MENASDTCELLSRFYSAADRLVIIIALEISLLLEVNNFCRFLMVEAASQVFQPCESGGSGGGGVAVSCLFKSFFSLNFMFCIDFHAEPAWFSTFQHLNQILINFCRFSFET